MNPRGPWASINNLMAVLNGIYGLLCRCVPENICIITLLGLTKNKFFIVTIFTISIFNITTTFVIRKINVAPPPGNPLFLELYIPPVSLAVYGVPLSLN